MIRKDDDSPGLCTMFQKHCHERFTRNFVNESLLPVGAAAAGPVPVAGSPEQAKVYFRNDLGMELGMGSDQYELISA